MIAWAEGCWGRWREIVDEYWGFLGVMKMF